MLTLAEVARELGCGRSVASKALRKVRAACPPVGDPPRWDSRVVDLIHALRGEAHRDLKPVHQDWLTRYQKGT